MGPTRRDWAETPPVTVSLEAEPPGSDSTRQRRAATDRQPPISVTPVFRVRSTFFWRPAIDAPALVGSRHHIERLPFIPG
jgi:hypothetical protein